MDITTLAAWGQLIGGALGSGDLLASVIHLSAGVDLGSQHCCRLERREAV